MSIVDRLPVDPDVGAHPHAQLRDHDVATIARVLDVSADVAAHIKAGTADVTVAEVARLAHFLGVDPWDFLEDLVRRDGQE